MRMSKNAQKKQLAAQERSARQTRRTVGNNGFGGDASLAMRLCDRGLTVVLFAPPHIF